MPWIKHSVLTVVSVILTASLLVSIFLFSGLLTTIYLLAFGFAVILVCAIFILIRFVKKKNQQKWVFRLVYLAVTSVLLLLIGTINFILTNERGDISASEKLYILSYKQGLDLRALNEVTADFLTLHYEQIIFKFTPDAKDEVEEIIRSMDELLVIEQEVFGQQLKKTATLEVIVFANATEYRQMLPLAASNEAGSYFSSSKKALLYYDPDAHDRQNYLKTIFSHEYGHYVYDVFANEWEVDQTETPIWYQEGLCEYMSSQFTGVSRRTSAPHMSDPIFTLDELTTPSQWRNASKRMDPYFVAAQVMEYIAVRSDSSQVFSAILLEQQKKRSFQSAFEELSGMTTANVYSASNLLDERVDEAWHLWNSGEYVQAEFLYKELTSQHPRHAMTWHQYAMMLEQQKRWDEAVEARRKTIQIEPKNAVNFLNLSYVLTVIDSKEAVVSAKTALALETEDYSQAFVQKWLDEIMYYDELLRNKQYRAAYESIARSEQLEVSPTIVEGVKERLFN